mgnify:CR=1 FL=1
MCGFTGFLGFGTLQSDNILAVAKRMNNSIWHRGPDDEGIWKENKSSIVLAHRRLSILDLSNAGHQPMVSNSGRFVIVFNGEVYNHLPLRSDLKTISANGKARPSWRGQSDTETLLAAIETWGLKEALKRSVGMFSFALWDKKERSLAIACDRMGEKPIYYGWQNGVFLFGSELKSMRQHPSFQGNINREAITLYLRYNYVPAPWTIYSGIYKLKPGCFIQIKLNDQSKKPPVPKEYWSLEESAVTGQTKLFEGTDGEAIEELHKLLKSSIGGQMIADVPLGAFLSGGIDSSTIVAIMQSLSSQPVKTFSIGFNEASYDEAFYAKKVSNYLGTDHTELYVNPEDAINILPKMPILYDEPFSDPSQIPTFLVSEMTRKYVKVALSGDGGDELFGGYNRYTFADNLWGKLSIIPRPLRRLVGNTILALPSDRWNKIAKPFEWMIPNRMRVANLGDKLHKGVKVLDCDSLDEVYKLLTSHWNDPSSLVIGAKEPDFFKLKSKSLSFFEDIERMMLLDMITYLPYDILVKVDRAAMGVSLETRIPFLDHRVVEFALSLPLDMKIRKGQGKWLLRQLLFKHVPKHLIERPKMGFGVPIDIWLRGPLREWAESLLNERRLRSEGYLYPGPIRQKLEEHLSGKRNWQYQLWGIIMFQAWLEKEKFSGNSCSC